MRAVIEAGALACTDTDCQCRHSTLRVLAIEMADGSIERVGATGWTCENGYLVTSVFSEGRKNLHRRNYSLAAIRCWFWES